MKYQFLKLLSTSGILILGMTATVVHAKGSICGGERTIFSCSTKSNKFISVCQSNDILTYSYGQRNKPELSLKRNVSEVIKQPWKGVGDSINYSIGFKNNNTVYNVFADKERFGDYITGGGVEVEVNDKSTYVYCRDNNVIDRIEELFE